MSAAARTTATDHLLRGVHLDVISARSIMVPPRKKHRVRNFARSFVRFYDARAYRIHRSGADLYLTHGDP